MTPMPILGMARSECRRKATRVRMSICVYACMMYICACVWVRIFISCVYICVFMCVYTCAWAAGRLAVTGASPTATRAMAAALFDAPLVTKGGVLVFGIVHGGDVSREQSPALLVSQYPSTAGE